MFPLSGVSLSMKHDFTSVDFETTIVHRDLSRPFAFNSTNYATRNRERASPVFQRETHIRRAQFVAENSASRLPW